ncbi:hypothetical protein F5051DRAFT_430669 [Lentinula edodes]|nr:hypothetical protein F5051DRAFT_430669 [Lentinula edodes]
MQAIESSNGKLSVRKAAKAYGIQPATLQQCAHGGKSCSEAHAHQQNLSPAQEDPLVEWIKVQGQHVCADRSALHPSVIFEGQRRDIHWGDVNPADASILTSPNGWTDQELGSLWLEKDFEPVTAAHLQNSTKLL